VAALGAAEVQDVVGAGGHGRGRLEALRAGRERVARALPPVVCRGLSHGCSDGRPGNALEAPGTKGLEALRLLRCLVVFRHRPAMRTHRAAHHEQVPRPRDDAGERYPAFRASGERRPGLAPPIGIRRRRRHRRKWRIHPSNVPSAFHVTGSRAGSAIGTIGGRWGYSPGPLKWGVVSSRQGRSRRPARLAPVTQQLGCCGDLACRPLNRHCSLASRAWSCDFYRTVL
jgi:hypothetical protein